MLENTNQTRTVRKHSKRSKAVAFHLKSRRWRRGLPPLCTSIMHAATVADFTLQPSIRFPSEPLAVKDSRHAEVVYRKHAVPKSPWPGSSRWVQADDKHRAICRAESLLAIFSLSVSACGCAGNFLLLGHEEREAETGMLRLARRASTAESTLCTFTVLGSP